jgi:murein DD-endopeptidase MepM/ murein hydrolase activator NlpD
MIAGLRKVSVNANQLVAEGDVLGTPAKNHRLSITCNGGSAPPSPPAVPTPASFEGNTFHLWFPGRVEKLTSGADGVNFVIVQTEDYRGEHGCMLTAAGFKTALVKQGDKVEGGAAIGAVGKHTTTNVKCEGKASWNNFVDGQPRGPDHPAVAPVAPPAAPVAPAAPVPMAHPGSPAPPVPTIPAAYAPPPPAAVAPVAPLSPRVAPNPQPAPMPAPAPQVAPAPAPNPAMVPRTPKPIVGASHPVLENGARISSPFGGRLDPLNGQPNAWHDGVDLAAPLGAPVHTPAAGKVTFAGEQPGYANVIEIGYADGVRMRYAHLDSFAVKAGDTVKEGDVIGTVGTDANSTGPHVHFEILEGGVTQDPSKITGLVLIGK